MSNRDQGVPRPGERGKAAPQVTYATSIDDEGYGRGLLVATRGGRPVRVAGHPRHPATLGVTHPSDEALLFSLHDERRARRVLYRGQRASQAAFHDEIRRAQGLADHPRGEGLFVALPPTSSPVAAWLLGELRRHRPEAKVCTLSPFSRRPVWQATELAFGGPFDPTCAVSAADVVITFDCDLFGTAPGHAAHALHFFGRRDRDLTPAGEAGATTRDDEAPRLYVVEPTLTETGRRADHRIARSSAHLDAIALALVRKLARVTLDERLLTLARGDTVRARIDVEAARFVDTVTDDLLGAGGRVAIVPGPGLAPEVQAALLAAWAILDEEGETLRLLPPPVVGAATDMADEADLVTALDAGRVGRLVILGGNPALAAAGTYRLAERLRRAKSVLYVADTLDETAALADWVVPATHPLERWDATRAFDGTIALQQPMLPPLVGGRSPVEVLGWLAGRPLRGHDLLTEAFKTSPLKQELARAHTDLAGALALGFLPTSRSTPAPAKVHPGTVALALRERRPQCDETVLSLDVRPDWRLGTFRGASTTWLFEMPDPVSHVAWSNVALLSPRTARRHSIREGDVLELRRGTAAVEIPACIQSGQAENVVTVAAGWGGHPGGGHGFNIFPIMEPWGQDGGEGAPGRGLVVTRTGRRVRLSTVHPPRAVVLEAPRGLTRSGASTHAAM